ncbi:MAG: adenylyl-sulfate kinase [Phycisphaerae bacterium]
MVFYSDACNASLREYLIMTNKRNKGFCLWFTGLPSAGKSTIAEIVLAELRKRKVNIEIFDGDVVRTHLSKGLGFSKEDRDTNIRRIGFVCNLLTRNGVNSIAAAISPYRNIRDENRKMIADDGGAFIEVFINTPIEICETRDVKGLYKKARAGQLKGFTGVDDPYEPPQNPEIELCTHNERPEESANKIVKYLEENDLLPLYVMS